MVLWGPSFAAGENLSPTKNGIGIKIGKIYPPSLGGSYCEMMLHVRNGLANPIAGLTFELALFDPDGVELAQTDYRVENLAAGRIRRQAFGIPITQYRQPPDTNGVTGNRICQAPATAEIRVLACALGGGAPPDACLKTLYEEPGGDLRLSFPISAQDPVITYEIIKPYPPNMPSRSRSATAAPQRTHITRLGMTLATLTAELAASYGITISTQGLVVVDIDAGGPGARSDVRIGDVVQEIDQDTVGTPGEVAGALANAAEAKHRSHLVLLDRDGEMLFRVVTAEEAPHR